MRPEELPDTEAKAVLMHTASMALRTLNSLMVRKPEKITPRLIWKEDVAMEVNTEGIQKDSGNLHHDMCHISSFCVPRTFR